MHNFLEDREEENVTYNNQGYNRKILFKKVIRRLHDESSNFPGKYSII